jgi:hypothetical protein
MKVGKYLRIFSFAGLALFMLLAPLLSVGLSDPQSPVVPIAHAATDPNKLAQQLCENSQYAPPRGQWPACEKGYVAGYTHNPSTSSAACAEWANNPDPNSIDNLNACKNGYKYGAGQAQSDGQTTTPSSGSALDKQANDACSNVIATGKTACADGYKAGYQGSSDKVCSDKYGSNLSLKKICGDGYTLGKNDKQDVSGTKPDVQPIQTDPSGSGSAKSQIDNQCLVSSGDLGWIICPVIQVIDDGINFTINNIVVPLLRVQPLSQNDNNGIYALWKAIRNIADIGFVLIFMFIIFANTLSINVNAYTAKKMLPRLVAAVILVQFSFLIASLAVDIGNILGAGIAGLISQVLSTTGQSGGGIGGVGSGTAVTVVGALLDSIVVLLIGLIAFAVVGAVGVLLFLGTALIGVIGAAFTLVARQLIIQFLVVISPIALAAWVLPGTENLFKRWYGNFIKLILMYPIIILLLSMGNVLGHSVNGTASGLQAFLAALFPLVAFLAIPATFKMSGDLMGFATGAILGRASGARKSIRGSQFAKDLKQQHKDEGAMRYMTSNSRLGKARGFLASGSLIPTAGAKRRVASTYNKAIKDRSDATNERFNTLQQNNSRAAFSDMLVAAARGQKVDGLENNPATQAAAIKKLVQTRNMDGLRQVANGSAGMPGLRGTSLWQTALKDDFGTVFGAAPDIAMGGFDSLASITPDRFADLHHSTIREAMDHIATMPDSVEKTNLQRGIISAATRVSESGPLSGKISNEAVAELQRGINMGVFTSDQVAQLGPRIQSISEAGPDDKGKHATGSAVFVKPAEGGGAATSVTTGGTATTTAAATGGGGSGGGETLRPGETVNPGGRVVLPATRRTREPGADVPPLGKAREPKEPITGDMNQMIDDINNRQE